MKLSSPAEASLPSTPGTSLTVASTTTRAASSPPASTKSPTESSPSTRWSAMRWSTPSYRPQSKRESRRAHRAGRTARAGELCCHGLVEAPTRRREQVQRARRVDELDGAEDRLGSEHHARTAAEGGIVDAAVGIGRRQRAGRGPAGPRALRVGHARRCSSSSTASTASGKIENTSMRRPATPSAAAAMVLNRTAPPELRPEGGPGVPADHEPERDEAPVLHHERSLAGFACTATTVRRGSCRRPRRPRCRPARARRRPRRPRRPGRTGRRHGAHRQLRVRRRPRTRPGSDPGRASRLRTVITRAPGAPGTWQVSSAPRARRSSRFVTRLTTTSPSSP